MALLGHAGVVVTIASGAVDGVYYPIAHIVVTQASGVKEPTAVGSSG